MDWRATTWHVDGQAQNVKGCDATTLPSRSRWRGARGDWRRNSLFLSGEQHARFYWAVWLSWSVVLDLEIMRAFCSIYLTCLGSGE